LLSLKHCKPIPGDGQEMVSITHARAREFPWVEDWSPYARAVCEEVSLLKASPSVEGGGDTLRGPFLCTAAAFASEVRCPPTRPIRLSIWIPQKTEDTRAGRLSSKVEVLPHKQCTPPAGKRPRVSPKGKNHAFSITGRNLISRDVEMGLSQNYPNVGGPAGVLPAGPGSHEPPLLADRHAAESRHAYRARGSCGREIAV